MKTKQTTLVAGIFAVGLMLELTAAAGEINVKNVTGSTGIQVVAPVAGVASAPSVNPNIQVEVIKSDEGKKPYPVLKDDLVNAGSPALAKVSHEEFKQHVGHSTSALNDGGNGTVAFDLDGKWTTTFDLDIAKAPKGYDITEIITSAAWAPNRACQKYELLISKVSAPDKFISMGIFEADAENAFATQIKLTGKQNLIESNVSAVKFNFMVPKSVKGGATETAYREIDIIGAASEK
jgi:hypothetical protein